MEVVVDFLQDIRGYLRWLSRDPDRYLSVRARRLTIDHIVGRGDHVEVTYG
jgi:hypothetical protein